MRSKFILYLVLAAVGLLMHIKTVQFDYTTFDDTHLILKNEQFLRRVSGIFEAFGWDVFYAPGRDSSQGVYYRPLLTVSFIWDYRLWGRNPGGYHLTNVALHITAALLLFNLLTIMGYAAMPSFVLSLLFLIHPVNASITGWIVCRNDSLLAIFTIISFTCLLKYLKSRRAWYGFITVTAYLAALFVKESAVAILPLLILYYLMFEHVESAGKDKYKDMALTAGLLVATGAWIVIRGGVIHNAGQGVSQMAGAVWQRAPAVITYLGKAVLPVQLSVFPTMEDMSYLPGVLAIAALCLSSYGVANKKRAVFGLLWFISFLLPALIPPHAGKEAASLMENRIYLPLIGLIICVMEMDFIYSGRKPLVASVALVLAVIFGVLLSKHLESYRNRFNFWQNAAETSLHSAFCQGNLAARYLAQEDYEKAQTLYQKAVGLDDALPLAHNNLGIIYAKKGLPKEAELEFKKEIYYNPRYVDAYVNLGINLISQGDEHEGIEYLKRAVSIAPEYPRAIETLKRHTAKVYAIAPK